MKILVNAISAKTGGGITFVKGFLPELGRLGREHEFHVFLPRDLNANIFAQSKPSKNVKVIQLNTSSKLLRLFFEQVYLPVYLLRHRVDLLFCIANFIPFFVFCKKIVWIQNIFPFTVSADRSSPRASKRKIVDIMTWLSVYRANAVIFSSQHSLKKALDFGVPPDKCRRIYLGVSQTRRSPIARQDIILSVSNIYPHKNFRTLIQAFALLEEKARFRLVIVGAVVGPLSGQEFDALKDLRRTLGLEERVDFITSCNQVELNGHYSSARICVVPSLTESFSFPVFEAMAMGLPVVAARASCLPEAVGNAGLLFDPLSPEDLAGQMKKLLSNPQQAEQLGRIGQERAAQFTWSKTVKQTLQCFKESVI